MLSIRKITAIGRTYRHLNRYRQILTILIKYGFGDLLERLKIDHVIEVGLQMILKKEKDRVDKLTRAERLRMVLEELGPTYIKLGQILSTRPDLIPVSYLNEFAKLQDHVPPSPFDEMKNVFKNELGNFPEDLYESFDQNPVASASIGQVYNAKLKTGEKVAVKVQRPGIKRIIEIDLEIMHYLADLVEKNIEEMAVHHPVKIVDEFKKSLEKEIDYTIEASNTERFSRYFNDNPNIYIPKVFRDMSSKHVLTMEFIDGIKVSEVEKLDKQKYDRKLLCKRGADCFLEQIFTNGFFHADPHPGNIFVLPDNVVCLIDFGMTGFVTKQTRENFVDLLDSLVNLNETCATQTLLKLTIYDEEPDLQSLEKDVAEFMGQYLNIALKDVEVGKLLTGLLELTANHQLGIPPDIFLMIKAFTSIEGIGLALDPHFDLIKFATPHIAKIKLDKINPKRILTEIVNFSTEIIGFIRKFPKDVHDISYLIRKKKITLQIKNQDLEKTHKTYNQIANRICFAIIIASLLISSSIIIYAKIAPLFYHLAYIGLVEIILAVFLGIWLVLAILKRGKL